MGGGTTDTVSCRLEWSSPRLEDRKDLGGPTDQRTDPKDWGPTVLMEQPGTPQDRTNGSPERV